MLALLALAACTVTPPTGALPPTPVNLHAGSTRGAIAPAGDVDGDGIPDVHVAGRRSGTEGALVHESDRTV